ncbi:MAG: amino acid ABC transporter substrate-binding protein [Chloroflexi bacterium]|nr:MAG: amino acid ABC transporter substrate-binding protein [Chloroflexota bacterium]RLC86309.1 MAG: amino acid ABC transporter substrate-binding protein [Chloroflexota bacterium]HEY73618.1 transporter substrate-binding domain-containing protein [Thermoflexia bacterium]
MRKASSLIKAVAVVTMLSMTLGLLAACAPAPAPEEEAPEAEAPGGQIDEILQRGVLKVGLDIFVPWAFKDKDGNLVGFEIDVANKLAEDMGVEVEFVPTEWSGLIPAMLTGKFDVIIGGMGIRTERALKVNFSIPYEWSGMDCVVSQDMLPGVTSLEELNSEDVIIAVRLGTTAVMAAEKFAPNAELHQFDTDEAVIQDVLNGNAHASFSSSPTPAFWASDYPDVLYRPLGGEYFTNEPSAFAVRKGDPDTLFFFNSWIRENEDWLQDRSDYWYGTKDWEYLLGE